MQRGKVGAYGDVVDDSFPFRQVPKEGDKFVILDGTPYFWQDDGFDMPSHIQVLGYLVTGEPIEEGDISNLDYAELEGGRSVLYGTYKNMIGYVYTDNPDRDPTPDELQFISDFIGNSICKWNEEVIGLPPPSKQASVLSPIQEGLSEAVWEDVEPPVLREDLKALILDLTNEVLLQFVDDPVTYVQRLILIGSITGRQYDEDADVDVNILVDIPGMAEELGVDEEELRISVRKTFININGELIPGSSHPINFFLSIDHTLPPADGIYDILEDKWMKRPDEDYPEDWDPFNALVDAMERAEDLAGKIDTRWGNVERSWKAMQRYPDYATTHKRKMLRNMRYLAKVYDQLHEDRINVMDHARKLGADPPQMSTENVVYKALEWWGHLTKMIACKKALKTFKEEGELLLEVD